MSDYVSQEVKYGRPVSYGEVFKETHTKADGTFVDHKAKQIAESYEKNLQEVINQKAVDAPETSDTTSEHSTQRTLTIEEKNAIFLKVIFLLFFFVP